MLYKSPLFRTLLLIVSVTLTGVLGFYLSEPHYTWFDALYMTVITISTVGYTEVGELSSQGKVFAIFFIIVGLLVFAFALRLIAEHLLGVWTSNTWKLKKNKDMIDRLKEHTIVCGFGRNGRQATARLKRHKVPFVVIENDKTLIGNNEDEILFFEGDALSDESLKACGIEAAKNLICALPNDADNLFVVLSARQLNPNLVIVSRVSEDSNHSKLALAGANHVIMPDKIGGDYMAAVLAVPDLIQFLGTLNWWAEESAPNVEEVSLSKIPKEYQNKTLSELKLISKTGCNVIGYRDGKGNQIINPDAHLPIEVDGKLIVLGTGDALKKLNAMFRLD